MARDPKLRKRNSLVIPGGLLVLYALAGLVYVWAFKDKSPHCPEVQQFLVAEHCYRSTPFLGGFLLLGLILLVVGLWVFRGKPAELPGYLHSGTPTHFVLALMASLAVIPALLWWILAYVEASQGLPPFMTTVNNSPFQTKTLYLLLAGGAFIAFLPFLGLYLAQGRLRRNFLREVEEAAAHETDPFPGEEPAKTPSEPTTVPPEEFVDESLWPASRAAETKAPDAPPAGSPTDAAPEGWSPPPAAAKPAPAAPAPRPAPATAASTPAFLNPAAAAKPSAAAAAAPVVFVATGCRAILPTGTECGKAVGPGGRYCVSHACQGKTASGSPCKNPAMEGATKCPAHA